MWKEDEKIEVVLQPIKKLIIFHCIELSIDEFFKKVQFILMSGHPLVINWAEGVVFLPLPYQPESDRIIEEMLQNGTTYWASVMCALMPEYRPINKMGAREIPIIDQTSVPYFRQVAQWLKKRVEARNPVDEKTN
jgi:hypothetical protein